MASGGPPPSGAAPPPPSLPNGGQSAPMHGNSVPQPLGAPGQPMQNGHAAPTHYQHGQSQNPPTGQPLARPPQPMHHPPQLQQQHQVRAHQQRHPQPLNGGWQSDKDVDDRRKMIAKIVQLLRQRKPNAPAEWLNKLPQMAKRLEESLYRSAASFDAYNDISTLKARLQQLAMNIGMKTKRIQSRPPQPGQSQQYQRPPPSRSQAPPPPPQGVPLQQPGHLQAPPQQPSQPQRQVVNISDINPNMASQQQPGAPMAQANYGPGQQQAVQQQTNLPPQNASAQPARQSSSSARQPSDRQQVLRHQQQRLLLLRHAAKCPHQDGQCPVTPHCAGMKRLWKHIAECKDQKCLVPHCVSSRYVLSHYHRCKDVRCPVCGPVREAIHRSHEKQKQMQALKQGHQAALKQNQLPPGGAQQGPPKRHKTAKNGQVVSQQPGYPPQQYPPGFTQQQQVATGQVCLPAPKGRDRYVYNRPAALGGKVIPQPSGPKPQEDHTLINCFTMEEIQTHIKSLDQGLQLPVSTLKTKFGEVLRGLQNHSHGWVFNAPVDPVELGLPDYFEVIEKPMDLSTVKKQLENGIYRSLQDVERDINLTFDNAMLYNPEGSVVWNMANELKQKFVGDYARLVQALKAEEEMKRRNGDACSLCGREKLLFEPPVFYCNGVNCRSKRIRRNAYYYVGGNNQYHWCQSCYDDLKETKPIQLAEVTLHKHELDKKKNNEVPEESWVQCDRCERWVHQICALFNTRQNKDQRSEFCCPRCTLEDRQKANKPEPTSTTPMAEDLPRTKLSEILEKHVRGKLGKKMSDLAQEKMKSTEGMSLEEATKAVHEGGGEIYVRQVTSMPRTLDVRERMKKRYSFKDYPSEFTYRCKCLVVFQNLDGVDVLLFGLYVYEHDETNAAPNKRTVYVSYLDSVYYMRPRKMRTFVYHELLISYLDYVRAKGYNTAHIWACPPLKGDDYILSAKPEDQKTPKDDRLRQWYIDLLKDCQRRGIVGKVTNAYDLYFANEKNDATILPYMEGDYFPAELENIIKDMEEGKNLSKKPDKTSSKTSSKKERSKKKKAGGRGGTRASGIDQDMLNASGIMPEGVDVKSIQGGGKDFVMRKLGETINPMKESFIVAYLCSKNQLEENLKVPKDIADYREKHGISSVKPGLPVVKDEPKADATEPSESAENTTVSTSSVAKPAASADISSTETKPSPDEQNSNGDVDDKSSLPKAEDKGEESIKKPATDIASASQGASQDTSKDLPDESKAMETESAPDKPSSDTLDKKDSNAPSSSSSSAPSSSSSASDADKKESDQGVEQPSNGTTVQVKTEPAADGDADMNDAAPPSDDVKVKAETNGDTTVDAGPSAPASADSDAATATTITTTPVVSSDVSKPAGDQSGSKEEVPKAEGQLASDAGSKPTPTEPVPSAEETKPNGAVSSSPDEVNSSTVERGGKFAAMEKKLKKNSDEPVSTGKPAEAKSSDDTDAAKTVTKDSKGRLVKIVDDDEEEMDCDFLNNRQAFLNLCQGNHYQFDTLRRAKHTSMMVLWHLHNREAPKFVTQCAICSREILQGKRLHCPTCADFDQCIECLRNPAVPKHPHPLTAIPVSGAQQTLTPEQRKERKRSIQLHMTLLLHASTCRSPKCNSANCAKMKGLLKHGSQCKVKAQGGCNICKRIWALLQIHARQCKTDNCPVPNCTAIRERYRQIQLQQQAMDDRRRQMMNETYRR